jgi:hypothetical protein
MSRMSSGPLMPDSAKHGGILLSSPGSPGGGLLQRLQPELLARRSVMIAGPEGRFASMEHWLELLALRHGVDQG